VRDLEKKIYDMNTSWTIRENSESYWHITYDLSTVYMVKTKIRIG